MKQKESSQNLSKKSTENATSVLFTFKITNLFLNSCSSAKCSTVY